MTPGATAANSVAPPHRAPRQVFLALLLCAYYFLIEFSQRPGALRRYLDDALGEKDDITLFEYIKKSNREYGPALVGIELARKEDFAPLLARMDGIGLRYEIISSESALFRFVL